MVVLDCKRDSSDAEIPCVKTILLGLNFFFPLDIPRVTPLLLNIFSKFLTTQIHKIEDESKS